MKTLDEQIEYMKQEVEWNCAIPLDGSNNISAEECDLNVAILKTLEESREATDLALERAAKVCEERGKIIGGAIQPDRTAKAIRALKSRP